MSVSTRLHTLAAFGAGLAMAIAATLVFQAWRVDAIGLDESTFVPITPCRLVDTRPDTTVGPKSTPIGQGEDYRLQVTGKNGKCVIPNQATAVSINLTGLLATAPTFVAVYPADAPNPGTSALNLVPGQPPTPNKLDVKLSPSGAVRVFNKFGSTHVIGDVLGYYRHDGLDDLRYQINAVKSGAAHITSGTTATGFEIWDRTAIPTGSSDHIGVKFPANAVLYPTDQKVNFAAGTVGGLDNDPNCTGSVQAPTAPSGKVCIYVQYSGNVERMEGMALPAMENSGFRIRLYTPGSATLGQDQYLWFSWAYRMP